MGPWGVLCILGSISKVIASAEDDKDVSSAESRAPGTVCCLPTFFSSQRT